MNRSTIAKAILPALLLQLLPPVAAQAEPGRTDLDRGGAAAPESASAQKTPPRPRNGPWQRLTDFEPPRPRRGPIPRVGHPGDHGGPERRERAQRFHYDAPNGFRIEVLAWPAERGGFTSSATLRSPSGERMTFESSPDAGFGPTVLIDGDIVVSYRADKQGRVRKLTVHDGERPVTSLRSQAGHADRYDAYLHLAESVAARHSPEFLREMRVALHALERDAVAPANLREILECALAITGYVASVWGILAGCTIAGLPTLGTACILAILAHEAAVASTIFACLPD